MLALEKPRARDILVVFALGGMLAGAAEGTCAFVTYGFHVPEVVWITAAIYLGIALAAGVIGWPLWRSRIGFVVGFAALAWLVPYALLVQTLGPAYAGYLPHGVTKFLLYALSIAFAAACTAWCVKLRESCMRWSGGLLVASAAALVVWACTSAGIWHVKQPPIKPASSAQNVIVIVIDTLRADHLSAYGYQRPTTPNIDRIASQGALFENAISASSWTLPGHASLVTGLYPTEHHTRKINDSLPSNLPTLAEQFFARGYRTAAFSANVFFFGRERGFGRGFQVFGDYFPSIPAAFHHTALGNWTNQFLFNRGWVLNIIGRQSAADINHAALRWIDGQQRPFFLMLNYLDVHDTYLPPRGSLRLWGTHDAVPPKRISETFNQYPKPTEAELHYEIAQYDNCLYYVDSQIAALMNELQLRGLDRNTLLVITADHGEQFDEHGIVTHANALYFSEIRVPLIFWDRGTIPAGVRISRPVSTVNIGATALDIAAGVKRPTFPGGSLTAFWTNGDIEHWPYPLSELAKLPIDRSFPNFDGNMQSIVTDKWHYVKGPANHESLYACCATGRDQTDISSQADSKAIMDALREQIENDGEVADSSAIRTSSEKH